jgi:hypothetical protein
MNFGTPRLLAVLFALVTCLPAAAAARAAERPVEGLWQGLIVYKPAELEVDVTVELARTPQGALAGTIDIPNQKLAYQPLSDVRVEGDAVSFVLSRYSIHTKSTVVSPFHGTLSADGREIRGEFVEGGQNHVPFALRRAGEAGGERQAPPAPPLTVLAAAGDELKAAFNRDAGKVRLVLLVSPTCPVCLISARVTERYVLDRIPDPRLRVYVVWGPMLGEETEADARAATVHVPDGRARHFWTAGSAVAAAFAPPLGLAGQPAWDTFQLFPAGARWGDAVPAPVYFMHVNKPLPPERRFNGEKLAEQVRGALAAK